MKEFFTNKYFNRVLALFSIVILITINLLSFILYKNYEINTINRFKKINIEILNETSRMNEYIGKSIKLSGMNLLYESPVQKLMKSPDMNNFEKVQAIRRMDSVQSMGMHIHSIYLYNMEKDYIYSTSNYMSTRADNFYDKEVIQLLNSGRNLKGFYPIPRWIKEGSSKYPVCTFFFFESNPMKENKGVLIINLDLKWLKEIEGEGDKSSSLYIVDQDRKVVYNSDLDKFLMDISDEKYIEKIFASEEKSGHFIDTVDGVKSLVMYSKPEDQEWYFIKLMPYNSLVDNITAMRDNTIKIILLFLVVGVGISFALSKKLSNPIDKWVSMMKEFGVSKDSDDITYITSSIEHMLVKASDLESMSKTYLNALHQELLKEIIVGNIKRDKDIHKILKEYKMPLSYHGNYHMILCYKGQNYISEDMDNEFEQSNYSVNIGENTVHILWNADPQRINRLIDTFKFMGVSSIAVSGLITSIREFNLGFIALNELLKEKIFYPKGYVLYYDYEITRYKPPHYPSEKEKDLISSLRRGEVENTLVVYKDFVEIISNFKYDYFKFYLVRLIFSIQNMVDELEIEEYFLDYGKIKRDYFEKYLEESNHISGLDIYFKDIFSSIERAISEEKSKRNYIVIEKAIEYISQNFKDLNLSLQTVSDAVGLSSSYLNQIFKTEKEVSISEYIVNYRIEKAKEYLIDKDFTIKNIANMVGFSNDNYFYTVFKKNTGLTPGQYRKEYA